MRVLVLCSLLATVMASQTTEDMCNAMVRVGHINEATSQLEINEIIVANIETTGAACSAIGIKIDMGKMEHVATIGVSNTALKGYTLEKCMGEYGTEAQLKELCRLIKT